MLARELRQTIGNLRVLDRLRRRHPGAHIGRGAVILGSPDNLTIGVGSEIEDGAVLDFRFGGSVALGERVTIRNGAILSPYGGAISIGDDSGVNHYTILYGHGGLTVGKMVRFAAHCLAIPGNHGIDDLHQPIAHQPMTMLGISIGDDVWVGGHSTILDGVTIGCGAVIAAGSVVTKAVSSRAVVAGVPARELKRR